MEAGVRPYTTTRVQGLMLCPWFPVIPHCGQEAALVCESVQETDVLVFHS